LNPEGYSDKPVLITGAGGFIATIMLMNLHALGRPVRALVHYNSRDDLGNLALLPKRYVENVEILKGDVTDSFFVRNAMKDCAVVFHLAAQISVPFSYKAPRSFIATNLIGTQNILDAALDLGTERVVTISSSEVYGTAQSVPINEGHPLSAQSPYAAGKIAADQLALSYHRSYGLPVTLVRPFNTYGPGQSARAIVSTLITQALASKEVRIGNPKPIRDFTYVDDVAAGIIACGLAESTVGEVVNLASGQGISIGDLAELVLKITHSEAEIVYEQERFRPEKAEVMELVGDASKAKALTGWKPEVPLETGSKYTTRFIEENLNLYKVGKYQI